MLPDSMLGGDDGKGETGYNAFLKKIQHSDRIRLELEEEERKKGIITFLVSSIYDAIDNLLINEIQEEGDLKCSLSHLGLRNDFTIDELKAIELDFQKILIPFLKRHVALRCQQVQRRFQEIVVTFSEIKTGVEGQDYEVHITLKE